MTLDELVPKAARHDLKQTLCGDVMAAAELWNAMDTSNPFDDQRGRLCWMLFKEGCPPPALSVIVDAAWRRDPGLLHGDQHVIYNWVDNRLCKNMTELFEYCRFRKPSFSGRFTVYRGVAGIGLEKARRGFSWTTDREGAAIYARYASNALKAPPLIVATKIRSDDVALYARRSRCDELVIFRRNASEGAWVESHG